MNTMTLALHDVHTYYGESHILQGVSFEAGQSAVTAVLGRNGAGKTTLCRTITGLTPARRGRILFDGTDITARPPHWIWRRQLASVPQGRRLFPSLTVREHLAIAARSDVPSTRPSGARSGQAGEGGGDGARRVVPWSIDRVFARFPRLSERQQNRGNELSGGEQQMLAIARALVANPVFLVMDEPTEGLSPAMVGEVATLIRELRAEGTSILLAEQNAAFAVTVADYVHVMSKGTIVHASDPQTLWRNEEVKTQLLGVPGKGS
jgi:branched-chain amino acid transport system ATP-binding protein